MRDDKDSTESKEEKRRPRTGPVDTANPEPAEEKPSITRDSTEGGRRRPRSANIRHTQRGRFTVEGPSGTLYAFGSHGVLKVKGEDVEALLAINRVQRSCCGPRAPQVLYPLVLA